MATFASTYSFNDPIIGSSRVCAREGLGIMLCLEKALVPPEGVMLEFGRFLDFSSRLGDREFPATLSVYLRLALGGLIESVSCGEC